MPPLYPAAGPSEEGWLDVGDGQSLHYEVSGRPDGRPAVVLHGGPGSGSTPWARRLFDPRAYRIVVYDQRGCGRSRPHASDPDVSLAANTTAHLLADMERLRQHLGIERWLILGSSWGTTLGLAYAQRHPERVSAMVLNGVTTTRRSEIDWLYRGLGARLPEAFERFRQGVPEGERDSDLVEAYRRRLAHPDAEVRAKAALDWHAWEAASLSADPDAPWPAAWADPAFRMARARIVTHYFANGAWLEEGALLREAGRLAGIRGVLVQGRHDLAAPLETAEALAADWPDAELEVVEDAGHSAADGGILDAIVAGTDRFRDGS